MKETVYGTVPRYTVNEALNEIDRNSQIRKRKAEKLVFFF